MCDMDKAKKINGKFTKLLKLKLLNGDCIITSLEQINTIAESKCLIVITRYSQIHSDTFREIMPIVINPKYVVSAERVDGWIKHKEGDK